MSPIINLFSGIPDNLKDERVETILDAPGFRIERIVSEGHHSPEGFWYDQDEHEEVILLKGKAVLRFEDHPGDITMNPGDYIHIERHRRHRVEWTDPMQQTIWLAIYHLLE